MKKRECVPDSTTHTIGITKQKRTDIGRIVKQSESDVAEFLERFETSPPGVSSASHKRGQSVRKARE